MIHTKQSCFKHKTCFQCNTKGHISKFCTNKDENVSSVNASHVDYIWYRRYCTIEKIRYTHKIGWEGM